MIQPSSSEAQIILDDDLSSLTKIRSALERIPASAFTRYENEQNWRLETFQQDRTNNHHLDVRFLTAILSIQSSDSKTKSDLVCRVIQKCIESGYTTDRLAFFVFYISKYDDPMAAMDLTVAHELIKLYTLEKSHLDFGVACSPKLASKDFWKTLIQGISPATVLASVKKISFGIHPELIGDDDEENDYQEAVTLFNNLFLENPNIQEYEADRINVRHLLLLSNISYPSSLKCMQIRYGNSPQHDELSTFLFGPGSRPEKVFINLSSCRGHSIEFRLPPAAGGIAINQSTIRKMEIVFHVGKWLDSRDNDNCPFLLQVANMPFLEELTVHSHYPASTVETAPLVKQVLRNNTVKVLRLFCAFRLSDDVATAPDDNEMDTLVRNNTSLTTIVDWRGNWWGHLRPGERPFVASSRWFCKLVYCTALNSCGKRQARDSGICLYDLLKLLDAQRLQHKFEVQNALVRDSARLTDPVSLIFGLLLQCPHVWSG